jgi:uncharacterized cupin superfamily protein
MHTIHIERAISADRQAQLQLHTWPIWEKAISSFAWAYDSSETCYLLAGEVTITPDHGAAVTLQAGDLARFPTGMQCTWQITSDLRKHYRFD